MQGKNHPPADFWDASPEIWVEGQEQYAEGWIKCFHALVGGEAVYDPGQWVSD